MAISYGIGSFPKSAFVQGAASDVRIDIAWAFWMINSGTRRILVDCGVEDPILAQSRGLHEYRRPTRTLKTCLGIIPAAVTDVVITHMHWDHTDGLPAFPFARVWIRDSEIGWARNLLGSQKNEVWGVRRKDLRHLQERSQNAANVSLLAPCERIEIVPGVVLVPGGGHTPGSQWVEISSGSRLRAVLASDAVYLYENLDERRPIGTAVSLEENRRAVNWLRSQQDAGVEVVPGHDPRLFSRHRQVAEGIVSVIS